MGTEVIAARSMNSLYIVLDICFLLILAGILWYTKRYQAAVAGVLAGLLYFAVDYGIFYLALGTRQVTGADPFWFLLWLSMSYGFTNFVWIWVWLDRDGHALEWSLLILSGWFATALLSQNFGAGFSVIQISRGTAGYHGAMALLLFVGYALLIVHNLKGKGKKIDIAWILAIGVLVQFGWEFMLGITGIRNQSLQTLLVNSLLETNLGLPYLYLIHRAVNRRRDEAFRPVTGSASVREESTAAWAEGMLVLAEDAPVRTTGKIDRRNTDANRNGI